MSRIVYALPRAKNEDVGGPQIRVRDDAVLRGMNERGDRVVTTCGLAQGTAGGVRSARVQEARLGKPPRVPWGPRSPTITEPNP